ncbi:hypothetical protein PC129_g22518 [Phytophthora cactorum]|uniref:BED-type domain-containing protein n=1 Tax=Phytophthora cactorum TaxID=29920 RepID=A0A8T1H2Q2_9STRA|nr:hypothetical protein PC122_g23066 [Phytophthora cactorum]KAG3204541.1 hypothetical protein PC129_g22518 [Phytophthora cactorum]
MLLTHVGDGFYNCTTCGKQYKKDNGYTILLNHLRRNHEDYKQDAQEAARRLNSLNLHLVSQRTQDLYRWIVWVVCDRLPFAFVKRRLTRLNVALSTISEDTLLRYIVLLFEVVDVRAARELPDWFWAAGQAVTVIMSYSPYLTVPAVIPVLPVIVQQASTKT